MKRARSKSPLRLSKDAEQLIAMSTSAAASGSRSEDHYWQTQLEMLASALMDRGNDSAIEAALDQTHQMNSPAHEILAASCEAASECCVLEAGANGVAMQAMLISVPLVVWSKYRIPAGPIDASVASTIRAQLHGHILSRDAKLVLNPFLYSIDQLPRSFSDTRKLTRKLAEAAVSGANPKLDFSKLGDSAELPADVRMLLGVAVVPVGEPLFQWQELGAHTNRADCLTRWIEQCRPSLAKLVPGCAFECGLPDAFFHNCRDADLRVRPHTLTSAIGVVAEALQSQPAHLSAVIAGVGETAVDEYRVSLLRKGHNDVLHGVVWPLYGAEDDDANPGPRQQIETILQELKISEITRLSGVLPPEYCEDCGAPLFFDHEGEAMHAEMPEDTEQPAAHYH
jgi:hypothetical protein